MHGGRAAAVRVLVLDDNPSIRLLCRVNLELDGFDVVEAGSLAEARCELAGGEVRVVVLDLHLRGEQSLELFDECRAAQPPIPIVLVTGSIDLGGKDAPEADVVLGKPFEIEELVASVRALAGRD